MANNDQPVIMESKKQVKVFFRDPNKKTEAVISGKPQVSDPKKSLGQTISKYAFGREDVSDPGKYIWESYLEPTGKRVANDIVEHFLMTIKHMFQRWIWDGKILDDGNGRLVDRTSFSNWGKKNEPVKASAVMSPVKEIKFDTAGDAQKVLDELKMSIQSDSEGHCATVRQYYEAANLPELCESGVSSSTGWTDLDKVEVKPHPDGDGFYLNMPRPRGLKVR